MNHQSSLRPTPTVYPRRPGSDDSGRDYEIKITALLALRCAAMEDTKEMWLGSNVDQVGDFDDIILCKQTPEGKSAVYMIQLKHQENPKNIASHEFTYSAKVLGGKRKKWKEDFALSKYCKGFTEFKLRIDGGTKDEFEIIEHLRKADRIVFVLFTNKGVNECDFLENIDDTTLHFLNTTNNNEINVFKFNHNKLNYNSSFLQQLILFSDQVHVNDANKLIVEEIENLVGLRKSVNKVNFKEIANDFVNFIKVWAKNSEANVNKKDKSRTCYTLTKQDILNKLMDILLEPYKLKFSKGVCTYYDCPQKSIWNEIIHDKTVTVVDFDDAILQFLKQYVGSEVIKYSKEIGKTWADNLSAKSMNLFYKEHENLNMQILKIVSSYKRITRHSVYKSLCFNKKVPLLLKIEDVQSYQVILKILKMVKYNLHVIIIANNVKESPIKIKNDLKHFITLDDLNGDNKNKILNQPVKLQGRSPVILGTLLDESMYKYIKCNDIIRILSNNFNIGNTYENLPEYFVKQKLSKVFLEPQILKYISNELFLIENKAGFEDLQLSVENKNNILLLSADTLKQVKELKSKNKVIHRLMYHNEDYLEWKESFGNTNNIVRYQDSNTNPENESLLWADLKDVVKNNTNCLLNNSHIISNSPGMGKSIFMNFMALNAPTNMWVLKITLNEYEEYFETKNLKKDHLNYFNQAILNKYGCGNMELAKKTFQKLLNKKQVLVLLDGFDEISISYNKQVTEIIEHLHKEGYCMWITTRQVMKLHLEANLSTVAITLKPFTEQDQKKFLSKYFEGICNDLNLKNPFLLAEFVEKLLHAAKINFNSGDNEFTGIPLQTKLLADQFCDNFKSSLITGIIDFDSKFDLLYLYEQFVRKKIDILCDKFGKDAKRTRTLFEEHQQFFALKILFDKKDLLELDIDKQLEEYYKNEQHKKQFLQREGIVVVEENEAQAAQKFRISFVHRTFAEYLAAQWLSQNFNCSDNKVRKTAKILLEMRFSWHNHYTFLFKLFDCILSKDCILHLNVINDRLEEAKTILKSNPDTVDVLDIGGRTILHILALYGYYHTKNDFESRGIEEAHAKLVDVIEIIPNNKITNIKDSILGYTALEYALINKTFAVANKFSEKSDILTINVNINMFKTCRYERPMYCFYYTSDDDTVKYFTDLLDVYRSLVQPLLPYFACYELLLNYVDKSETIKSYCQSCFETTVEVSNYVKHFHVATISELFQFKNRNDITSPVNYNYYYDLRLAAAFGTEDNMLHLISSHAADIIKKDFYNNTPLIYAVIHGRLDIVKLLVSKGAQVNLSCYKGNTAIHYAARNGYNEIIIVLMCNNGDINKQNSEGETPLILALRKNQINTANLLLLNGVNCLNKEDKKGNVPLHFATKAGDNDLVLELLTLGASINNKNSDGETPLLLALLNNHENTGKLILFHGADFTINNNHYTSPLHVAAQNGFIEILIEIFTTMNSIENKHEDIINIQNKWKETPLHLSVCKPKLENDTDINRQLLTVDFLLKNGANVNAQNEHGNSTLHYICNSSPTSFHEFLKSGCASLEYQSNIKYKTQRQKFYEEVAEMLLNKEAIVNLQNIDGKTAIDFALNGTNTQIISFLQEHLE